MKFGQSIEYNTRNIFHEKLYAKLFPDPFLKNPNWAYSVINGLKVYSFFLSYTKLRAIKISKLSCRPIVLTSYEAFLKKKLRLVLLPHFLHDFWRKIFLLLYSLNWPNFIFWLPLFRETLGNMCIVIVC